MLQRIRYGIELSGTAGLLENIVEADETYIGARKRTSTPTNDKRVRRVVAASTLKHPLLGC